MSLHGGFDYHESPGIRAYEQAEQIPEALRCTYCEGLGTQRVRHSTSGKDWQECHWCHGRGKKPVETHKLNDLPIKAEHDKWWRISVERDELMRIAEWLQKHQFVCEGDAYIVAQSSSSGIGTNTIVRCCKCNDSADVTAYESW